MLRFDNIRMGGGWDPSSLAAQVRRAGRSRISATSGRDGRRPERAAQKHIKWVQIVKDAQIVPGHAAIAEWGTGRRHQVANKMGIANLHPGLSASALRRRYVGKNPQLPRCFWT